MKFQSKTKIGIFIGAVVIFLVIGVLFFLHCETFNF